MAQLTEQTTAILNGLPTNTSPETKVLVDLIKLLLDEVKKSDLSSLKGLIEVQKNVTDALKTENDRLRERLGQLEGQ